MQKLYPTSNSETWLIPTGLLTSIKYNYYFQIWPYNGYKNIFLFDKETLGIELRPAQVNHF